MRTASPPRWGLVLPLLVALSGCGGSGAGWVDAGGHAAPDVLSEGPLCDHGISVLSFRGRTYVGRPQGIPFPEEQRRAMREGVPLPPDAVDTGYHEGDRHLWVDPTDDSIVYVVTPERVEPWYRTMLGCV